jgi:hypothetical protein
MKTSPVRSNIRRRLVTAFLSGLVGCGIGQEAEVRAQTMKTNQMTLWEVVDALSRQIPFEKEKIEVALASKLRETEDTGNDVFQFFKSDRVYLQDGVVIANVDLRIKRSGGHPGFISLALEGPCIDLDQLRRRYDKLEITGAPRGGSLDEQTYHSVEMPWGKLSFGFKESNPKCLASVIFKPKEKR